MNHFWFIKKWVGNNLILLCNMSHLIQPFSNWYPPGVLDCWFCDHIYTRQIFRRPTYLESKRFANIELHCSYNIFYDLGTMQSRTDSHSLLFIQLCNISLPLHSIARVWLSKWTQPTKLCGYLKLYEITTLNIIP